MTRRVPGRLLVVLLLAGTGVVAGPVRSAGAGTCTGDSGVTVVVDFRSLGGGTVVRCAPGRPATGLAALRAAGFGTTGVQRWGDGFICRISGLPSPSDEPCIDTPPPDAFWSYWHAANGGSWTLSDAGALGRRPEPGGFEGWSFSTGASAPPRVRPVRPEAAPAPAPPRPRPRPGARPGRPGGAAGSGKPGSTPTTTPAGARTLGTTTTTTPAATTTTAAPDGTTPADSTLDTPAAVAGGDPGTPAAASGGGPGTLPVTVGGVVLLVLLGAGGWVAARRRRAGTG